MKRLIPLGAALLIAGCSAVNRSAPNLSVYDFGPPAARLPQAALTAPLALEVRLPAWSESPGIQYRLGYDDPLRLRLYAGSHWAGAPGGLIAQRLRQLLAFDGLAAHCLLRVEVQEFTQFFDSPQTSRAVLRASLRLSDARRQPLAGREVTLDRPAATPDATGGVHALVKAGDALGAQLGDWLSELDREGALKACASR